ncbi:MAG TPA: DUF134 domain-containing protein [Halanaerobiales bacterium]|nr:DUF134 domain-containing protein [Halanaerobiales bacterium]
MPRPPKRRRIKNIPYIRFFKPAGIPGRELEEVLLSLEEVEALRLKDVEGLNQTESAEKMNISRPTFQRIITKAHQKVAEALLEGKALRFEGGDYELDKGRYRCKECGAEFMLKINKHRKGHGRRNQGKICPECGANAVEKIDK